MDWRGPARTGGRSEVHTGHRTGASNFMGVARPPKVPANATQLPQSVQQASPAWSVWSAGTDPSPPSTSMTLKPAAVQITSFVSPSCSGDEIINPAGTSTRKATVASSKPMQNRPHLAMRHRCKCPAIAVLTPNCNLDRRHPRDEGRSAQ